MSYLPRLAAALLPVALSLAGAPARADTLSFGFSGTCVDCTGVGTGTLVLNNYTIGTAITPSNFVSFTYDGTDLLGRYTISSSADVIVGGSMSQPLPGPENFYVFGDGESFSSLRDGFWCTGGGCISDFGLTHVWTAASANTTVPEPMTITLLGGGLLGLAALRRR